MSRHVAVHCIPAAKANQHIGLQVFEYLPLYNHPDFINASARGHGWYAKVQAGVLAPAYFPFTGEKWFWRWRIYQTPFCQRFTPFCLEGEVAEEHWVAWFDWLKKNTWACHWAHSLSGFGAEVLLKRNQFFSLNHNAQTIMGQWKGNRKSALGKGKLVQIAELDHPLFLGELKRMRKALLSKQWRPSHKEIKILRRISQLEVGGMAIHRFGMYNGSHCLALVLVVFWAGRFHYLFSLSSPTGLAQEAITRFFYHFIEIHQQKPYIFDFEGSNLEGVASFFRSFGASEELYGVLSF